MGRQVRKLLEPIQIKRTLARQVGRDLAHTVLCLAPDLPKYVKGAFGETKTGRLSPTRGSPAMKRFTVIMSVTTLSSAAPTFAYAATSQGVVIQGWSSYLIGVLSLLAAIFLLIDAVLLRRVAHGGAIAENISFMVLGVICLAVSVLVEWILGFLPSDMSLSQIMLASDAFVMLSMVLLGLYFWRVRCVLAGYLKNAKAYASTVAIPAAGSRLTSAEEPMGDLSANEGGTRV